MIERLTQTDFDRKLKFLEKTIDMCICCLTGFHLPMHSRDIGMSIFMGAEEMLELG